MQSHQMLTGVMKLLLVGDEPSDDDLRRLRHRQGRVWVCDLLRLTNGCLLRLRSGVDSPLD